MNTRLLPQRVTRRGGASLAQLLVLFAALMALLLSGFTTMSPAGHTPGEGNPGHCPDHQDAEKDENPEEGPNSLDVDGTEVWLHYSDDLKTVEFYADEDGTEPLAVDFCVKAANRHSGEHTGTEFTVDWTNQGGNVPEISYVVVYRIADGPDPDRVDDLTLDPQHEVNEPGDTHTVTATATLNGEPADGVEVRFQVVRDGVVVHSDTGITGPDGTTTFSYVHDTDGDDDLIFACTNPDGTAPDDCRDGDGQLRSDVIGDTATKQWRDDGPDPDRVDDLTLDPQHEVNEPGDTHTVTATATLNGEPADGVDVRFQVVRDGVVVHSDTGITGPDGTTTFSYVHDTDGDDDLIFACTNPDGTAPDDCRDGDGQLRSDVVGDTAMKEWRDDGVSAFFCRADTATLSLVGDEILLLFEANEQSEPCADDADGLLYALDPILGPTGLLNDDQQLFLGADGVGGLLLDVLWSRTDASDGAHANSGVLYLALNDGSDDQVILELLTSSNTTDSDCNTTTTATVLSLTLAGTPIEITGGNVVLIVEELDDLIILRLEDGNEGGADEGPDDTGAQAVDALILGAADLLGLTIADSESGCTG